MTDGTNDDHHAEVSVLTLGALMGILEGVRCVGHAIGERDAYSEVLGYLSKLKDEANSELTRNEHSEIAIAQVMILATVIQHFRDRPAKLAKQAKTDTAALCEVFEVVGLLPAHAIEKFRERARGSSSS